MPTTCPRCSSVIPPHDVHSDLDPFVTPPGATATVWREGKMLQVQIPSQYQKDLKSSRFLPILMILFTVGVTIVCPIIFVVKIFIDVTTLVAALGVVTVIEYICLWCLTGFLFLLGGIAYCVVLLPFFYSKWIIRIDENCVETQCKTLVFGRTHRYPKAGVKVENYQARSWKARLRLSYWFNRNPAWGRKNTVYLTTPEPFVFPCENDDEKKWLINILESELNETKTAEVEISS